jgi:hypothetical protein
MVRNRITQPHWYSVVSTSVRIVSTVQRLRLATHARPTFSSSRYAKSGIGRFSPVERSAGVAKPPSSPRTAMNSESRRIDSSTAVAVTSASMPKATLEGIRCHSACAAKKVENRIAIAAASSALAVTGYRRAAFRSQTTSSAMPVRMPIATRTGGASQP